MLTNYKSQCESVVKSWVSKSAEREKFKHISKDKFENLALENYQEFIAECKVEITHSLGVGYAQKIVAGSTDKQGVLVSSKAEYEKAVESHLAQESKNPQHLKLLFDEIKQSAYAQHSEKSTLLTTNAIIYEHSCQTCKGNTEQKCTECRGQGELRCDKCGGKGEYRCSWCDGRGEDKCSSCYGKGRCRICEGSGRRYNNNKCSWCEGSGKCDKCNGKGTVWCRKCKAGFIECRECDTTGYIECPTCEGTTIATCKACRGTNKITQIAQICVTTTPKYAKSYQEGIEEKIKAFIDKYEPQKLADIANITRTELRQDEKERCVVEIYQIQMPFAKFNVAFNGKKFAWLICGKDLQIEAETNEMLQALKSYNTTQEIEKQRAEKEEKQRAQEEQRQRLNKAKWAKRKKILLIVFAAWFGLNIVKFITDKTNEAVDTPKQSSGMQTPQTRQIPPQIQPIAPSKPSENVNSSLSGGFNDMASENSNKTAAIGAAENAAAASGGANADTAANESVNSSASAATTAPSIRLATKDEYVNLRKAPSGEVLTPIYKKDFDKITIKRLEGGDAKWLKVLYFPPNVSDESKALTGYIHISQIDASSL